MAYWRERLSAVRETGRHVASDAATQAFMCEIPQCWMTGQAAGTAVGLAARTGLAPRALDVEELRKELRLQGAFLHEP